MAIVFQYGSNCSSTRLNSEDRLCGDAQSIGLATTVENHELLFNVWSNGNRCAAASILEGGAGPVLGVLYSVPNYLMSRETSGDRRSFDAIEGSRYERRVIAVRQHNGELISAITYVARTPQDGLQTSVDYVRHIIIGLREHGADAMYIEQVKRSACENNPSIASQIQGL